MYLVLSTVLFSVWVVLLVYFVTNNFYGFKLSIAARTIKLLPAIGVLAIYLLLQLLIALVVTTASYQLLIPINLLIPIMIIVERKKANLALDGIALTWFLAQALICLLLIPLLVTLVSSAPIMIIYSFITAIAMLLCQKLDFNKPMVLILRQTIFKTITCLLAIVFLLIALTIVEINRLVEYSLIVGTVITPIVISLTRIISMAHQDTAVTPNKFHDAKKLMMLLDIKTAEEANIEILKAMLAESIELMNLQLPAPEPTTASTKDKKFETFINRTIESMKVDKKTNTKIISNIEFIDTYNGINIIKLAYIIWLLLEYAIDTLTKRPIYIDITSTKASILIQLSYEYQSSKNYHHLQEYFIDSEPVQSKIVSNFNLSKLKSLVDEYDGKLTITKNNDLKKQVNYLLVGLIFRKEAYN